MRVNAALGITAQKIAPRESYGESFCDHITESRKLEKNQ